MERFGEQLRLSYLNEPDFSVLEAFRFILTFKEKDGELEEVIENPALLTLLEKLDQAGEHRPIVIDGDEALLLYDLAKEYMEVFGNQDIQNQVRRADNRWRLPEMALVEQAAQELTGFIDE